jgi:intraflagellar transport protein 80
LLEFFYFPCFLTCPRALDLALKHKTHIDTVLGRRQLYLAGLARQEQSKKFLQLAESITVDWDIINSKIALDAEQEKQRPGAKPL